MVESTLDEGWNDRDLERSAAAGKSSIAAVIPAPVQRWQDQVHALGVYDLEVDTSVLTPEECASAIHERLTSPPSALRKVSDTF